MGFDFELKKFVLYRNAFINKLLILAQTKLSKIGGFYIEFT